MYSLCKYVGWGWWYDWLVCVTLLQCFSSPAQPRFIQTTHRHPAEAMGNQKNIWISALVLVALLLKVSGLSDTQVCNTGVGDTIHNYSAKTINGTQYIPFSHYAGKHVLIVNVATYWGLTFQYVELNALHEEFRDVGFTILGFPCNQFGKQEPGDNNEILPALKYVRPGNGFVPKFPLFEKVDVNGDNEQALFTFLKVGHCLIKHYFQIYLKLLATMQEKPVRTKSSKNKISGTTKWLICKQ